jgi:hypothetical protein
MCRSHDMIWWTLFQSPSRLKLLEDFKVDAKDAKTGGFTLKFGVPRKTIWVLWRSVLIQFPCTLSHVIVWKIKKVRLTCCAVGAFFLDRTVVLVWHAYWRFPCCLIFRRKNIKVPHFWLRDAPFCIYFRRFLKLFINTIRLSVHRRSTSVKLRKTVLTLLNLHFPPVFAQKWLTG